MVSSFTRASDDPIFRHIRTVQRFQVEENRWLQRGNVQLEQYGIHLSVFHPLNHAMPLKQSKMRTAGPRICRGCGSASSGANAWYLHPYATEEKPLHNCSACYWYRARDSFNHQSTFFNRFRARLTAGPCENRGMIESVAWCWHGEDKDRVIWLPCRAYWLKYGDHRPMKRAKTSRKSYRRCRLPKVVV